MGIELYTGERNPSCLAPCTFRFSGTGIAGSDGYSRARRGGDVVAVLMINFGGGLESGKRGGVGFTVCVRRAVCRWVIGRL